MHEIKSLYSKDVGKGFDLISVSINSAYKELKQKGLNVTQTERRDMHIEHGIYIWNAGAQFTFFAGCWYSYYATCGIPLCFSIQSIDDNKWNKILEDFMLHDSALIEYKKDFQNVPVCGLKEEKLEDICRNDTLADFIVSLFKKSNYNLFLD